MWYETDVSQGDVVSLKAVFNKDRDLYIISNEIGMIVLHPDLLISGTSVAGSIFCARKSVLSERFKIVDDGNAIMMIVGSIVHEIVQKALKDKLTTLREIEEAANVIIFNKDIIHVLYSNGTAMAELEMRVYPYLDKIFKFMQYYVQGNEQEKCNIPLQNDSKIFEGRIAEVKDIEENIWSPRLGLKGKVDATVTIYPPNNLSSSYRKTVPVEIKTGAPSFSYEHKGQLIIYQMMLQDMGKQIDSGLLLYIKEGIMSELRSSRAEENGLIFLRNRFATYMKLEIVERDKTINLPEPIRHPTACQKCPYNVICCTFQKKDTKSMLAANHPLYKVLEDTTTHLTDAHYSYFLHWCHIITLEHNDMQRSSKIKHLWTKSPEFRAAKGKALINLRISDLVIPQDGEFIHQFSSEAKTDFTALSFETGDYLVVSINERVVITAGRISKIEPSIISLLLPKDLSRQFPNHNFHLDKYENQSQSVFNFTNIGILLKKDEEKGIDRLRGIIIDKDPSSFASTLPKSIQETVDNILRDMNSVQRKAILKALTCENYMLIKGN